MKKTTPAAELADRLARPQRIGVFGHRGVGKTTLLAMLYREAVSGRLPGLRLAAGDARTAAYLGDKVQQLEAGEALPGTLAETELRFHLYSHHGRRIDLVVMDYQGEHVALGKEGGVRDFLRDCDAIWLCLDAPVACGDSRLPAEQEVEQLVEDYLATERAGEPHRPMALLVTKADLLGDATDAAAVRELLRDQLRMTCHALDTHCPWHALFAVSSLGHPSGGGALAPTGLEAPLGWLAQALFDQDLARLGRLWQLAPGDLSLIGRCTEALARRYPDAPEVKAQQRRLSRERWRRLRRRALAAVASLLALTAGLWSYDAYGAFTLRQELAASGDAAAQREAWRSYQARYPTRHLFRAGQLDEQAEAVAALDRELRGRAIQERLAELRRRADDPDAPPEQVRAEFLAFREEFPEHDLDAEGRRLRERIARADAERREAKGQLALSQLDKAEAAGKRLPDLAEMAAQLLRDHPGTSAAEAARLRLGGYRRRIDEADYEEAVDYSKRHPANFLTRQQMYQRYITRQPNGAFVAKARAEIARVGEQWDRDAYCAIRDRYVSRPGDVEALRALCRAYQRAHPKGKYVNAVAGLLRWCNQALEPGEYTVKLVSGSFQKKVAAKISRGAYLSVTVEVNGIRHGPSTIVRRSYDPEWNYTFPRAVRWKTGDSVRVIVVDNYYWRRTVSDETFEGPLAMRRLSGEVPVKYGRVTFSSDFKMPVLPKAE